MLSKVLIPAFAAAAEAVNFTVKSSGGNATSPYQYGIMYEDINFSGDGGVYAELVQNRAFQGDRIFPKNLNYHHGIGGVDLALSNLSDPLSSVLDTSMQVTGGTEEQIGFWNEGFWGFPIVRDWQYNGSFYMHGHFDGNITVSLKSNATGDTYAESSIAVESVSEWKQFSYKLNPKDNAPDSNNTLQFTMPAASVNGPLDFNLISLFPPTYNNRENGLRIDLMEAMAGLNPSFFRFPGGNNLEGPEPPFWFNWTNTIGPLENRPGFPGPWNYEQTLGLGLLEYALWAEDLGMAFILDVWAGLWLDGSVVPENELQPYVQSAMDELEFLVGSTETTWGAKRAELGHAEPFTVNMVEIGNEDSLNDGAASYAAYRFEAFYAPIRAQYPDMKIIASYFDVEGGKPPHDAAGDFHEYAAPLLMSSQFGYFDNYTTDHPVFIGEYAVVNHDLPGVESVPRAYFPFWYGTVAEAIFLLSAERNSDKIIGAAWAPIFMNLNNWQWIPDMIQYDANPAHTTLSTSYRMVELFSNTRMTETLPATEAEFGPAYWVAGRNADTGSHILKAAVYNSTEEVPFEVNFEGVSAGAMGNLTFLTAAKNSSSTVEMEVIERHSKMVEAAEDGVFSFTLPEYSVALMEVKADTAGKGRNYDHEGARKGWQGCKSW